MISTWKKRRAARRAMKEIENGGIELAIPNHFRCPISLDLMKDPVTLSTGITYDRESIEKWIEGGRKVTCPITNQVLRTLEPIPNHTIRKMIQDWCVDNKSYGIERIPTPRIPISSIEVLEIQSKISSASKDNDQESCRNSVVKIKTKLKENERNKRTILSNSTATVLSSSFIDFSRNSSSCSQNATVLEEILSCLTLMFPLDQESKNLLGSSTASMNCLVWFLKSGDLSARRNAVLVLKELISSDSRKAENLSRIEGSSEALFKLIQEPICPTATKASLLTIYAMVTSNSQHIISRFVEMGVVSLLIEMLVDSEKSKCEKALAILDRICSSDTGREKAYDHSLTIPVLVKKIHRVSETATEFSVAILWKVCKNEKRNNVAVEALQVGAFQKLLLLLQVGCGERTKERATELLKLLNPYREKLELECIDSADFKDLKRPF